MIAYDSNVLIYFLENNPEFADASELIIRKGQSEGTVLSVLALQEVLNGFALRNVRELGQAKKIIDRMEFTSFADVTQAVADQALKLTVSFGRKAMNYDAIHLATALENGIEEFYTNDHALLDIGRIKHLKILPLKAVEDEI